MSRLTDLIAKAKAKDPQLGADLDREIKILSSRLPFGLNFERHSPEVVELPLRPIRKGDKVRVLPERGSTKKGDQRLWQVKAIHKAKKVADLELLGEADVETQTVALSDLVVIAEFRDTIWPGLVSTGKVQRGGDKPFHSVINGENYHVLKALTYTHRGKVDAIYIDPPYNTGAKDWKYNNDYVEEQDLYRHSKWLAFMERRLKIAKELLNPADSVLIVTIDEKEYLRLGLLLEQTFPEGSIQMISSVINPKGTARANEFSRIDEYIFFVTFGSSKLTRWSRDMLTDRDYSEDGDVRWRGLARTGRKGLRPHNPGSWYPIYIKTDGSGIHSVGDTVPLDEEDPVTTPEGTIAVWPPSNDGQQYSWSVVPSTLRELISRGAVRLGRVDLAKKSVPVYYLSFNQLQLIEDGVIQVTGRNADGSLITAYAEGSRSTAPKTIWNMTSHDAGSHGTNIIRALLPGRRFPFPKSLYAVEDALRFFVANKPEAIILDFFSGSGTTAHAVMRLNKQDGGRRQCISVTNNEVAADEQKKLREQGLRPGDSGWEERGICDYITKPRVQAAITGKTPDDTQIKGEYKITDVFPMSEGFEENAEFFTLTYEAEKSVSHNLAYSRIAPLLWLRAGARGKRIEKLPAEGWVVADAYGLLSAVDQATPFIEAISHASDVRMAFIVTDDDRHFQAVTRRLPKGVEPVRLYESYLTNFSFTSGELTE
ncbi:site-specific DNA-methyltransferase [Cronobacter turicensis]|nr:site-specific DNA-methyltransferase [Cronobacter turicensis]EMA1792503.1 site-specific DNA-methyltransferase [Cronobacter turicensis]EMA1801333.1 site-specific DNA-methyltransferase [Cronobacter turicensis]EMA1850091.1 site-specific DNA-methyltransferase [Cronobacter turicensis]EMA1860105.1 site-specific DNA-methyltransferase [Cronobacter turicensis]